MKIDDLLTELSFKENFEHGTGANPAVIIQGEVALGVLFTEEYKFFLKRFGYASWFGGTIYGFHPAELARMEDCDVVRNTIRCREKSLPNEWFPIPTNTVVLEASDTVTVLFCLDSGRDGQVACIDYDEDQGREFASWPTFAEYVNHLITECV